MALKNDYEIRGNITAIFLKSEKYGDMETLIDTSDLPKAQSFPNTWHLWFRKSNNSFYVQGCIKVDGQRKTIQLHRWLVDAPPELEVDHIYHKTLDNRRSQIRFTNRSQNAQNIRGATKKSKSGVRGVFWEARDRRWRAVMTVNKKRTYVGSFNTKGEAEKAVKEARANMMPFSKEATLLKG